MLKIIKIFNLNYPVTDFFFWIYKFNIYFFIFIINFLNFFLSFFLVFFLYNFFLKNNKFFFLKNIFFEIFWVFIPFYFITFIFFYSTFLFLRIKKIYNIYLNIKIISYQWKWYFIYLNKKNLSFFSIISNCIFKILNFSSDNFKFLLVDNKLIVPVNKIVRIILLSNDVVHSFYVPSLGLKQDSIPGFLKNFYFKSKKFGNYFGYCTELCGKNHSYMPIIFKIVSNNSYIKWQTVMFLKKYIILNY